MGLKMGSVIFLMAAAFVGAMLPPPPPTEPPDFPSNVVPVELQSCNDLGAGNWRTIYTVISTNDVCFYRVLIGQGE
jgi:hypothetical protein